jgi:hypothetical protein
VGRTGCLNICRPCEAFNGRPCFGWLDREELDVFVRLTGPAEVSTWIEFTWIEINLSEKHLQL